ncbi:hypothetical protein J6590_057380 [Homalodisca vitripennis]|nr:hypothetical protein J6590_057380 [Homalodisca vitripennis]
MGSANIASPPSPALYHTPQYHARAYYQRQRPPYSPSALRVTQCNKSHPVHQESPSTPRVIQCNKSHPVHQESPSAPRVTQCTKSHPVQSQ